MVSFLPLGDDEAENSKTGHIDALFRFSLETLTVSAAGFEPSGTVGMCVKDITGSAAQNALDELNTHFSKEDEKENPETEFLRDSQAFRWIVFRTSPYNFDRNVSAVNFVLRTLIDYESADSIVAVLYEVTTPANQSAYIVYSTKSNGYYPFAPSPEHEHVRDTQLEGDIHDVLTETGVKIVTDKDSWHPLWPPEPHLKPWGLDNKRS
ncbi:PspA-associated protein PspAB [Salinibaculum rarum]|uniref:PspA-associated protein PspAB n=1 Tax=Salinibaculum rarum TaxID=3058903 RepID=UPI00265FD7B1|nr:hypothetical protein [Salinibaculum sp. KK48]